MCENRSSIEKHENEIPSHRCNMKIEQGRHPETTQRCPYAPCQRYPRYVEHFLLKLFEQKNIPDKQDFFFQKKIEKSQKDEKKEKKKLT